MADGGAAAWYRQYLPKIYLLTTSEYPKFEYPRGSGMLHEYPHYIIAGKKLPTGHVGLLGLTGLLVVGKLLTSLVGGRKSGEDHGAAVAFPAAKRDFSKEKQEFMEAFVKAELAKSHHHH